MLFYSQLKREFSQASWKAGQNSFSQKRVTNVSLKGNLATAEVSSVTHGRNLKLSVILARGTIVESCCGCRNDMRIRRPDKHCEHAAAVCIWIVERGSLLRSGIEDESEGMAPETPAIEVKPIFATPVLYVRGQFDNRVLTGIAIEPAIKYRDPTDDTMQIKTMNLLTRHTPLMYTWKTPMGLYLRLSHETLPVLDVIEAQRVIYSGRAALENLAKLLNHPAQDQMHFHEDIHLEVDSVPLKLISMHVGKHSRNARTVSLIYEKPGLRITSDDLAALTLQGRVSDSYIWKDRTIHRLQTSLLSVYQFANRSGVATLEVGGSDSDEQGEKLQHTGYAYLHDDGQFPLHPLAVYRLSLELGLENFTVDDDWKEFQEWKANFEKKKIAALPKVDYGFELRDYQVNGLSWLWSLYHRGLSALLADDMGLGKTHQVLAFLSSLYAGRDKKAPTLVVAPTSVVAAWKQKLVKYPTGLRFYIFHGNSRSIPTSNVDLVLTTYGILQREAILREKKWEVVVMDEAQAIKNASTISSRAARSLKSRFKIAMTGTPVENQTSDLWSIMEYLLSGYLGSLPRFKRLYGSGREIPTLDQANALKRLVTPFLLRRTKSQVLKELPEKTEEVVICELTPAQKKAYREALMSAEAEKAREDLETEGKVNYANILAVLTRLKQICDHPRLADYTGGRIKKISALIPEETGKWEAFDELLNEALRSNLKIVIFTQYLGIMDFIGHHLEGMNVGYTDLRGDTQDRSLRLELFANDPDCRVFVCSLLAGGLGIDLTAGSVCIHFDRWWNPAKENQATDRLHRLGQTRGVQVFKLQIGGTVEDRIAQIIESKKELSGALIEESPTGLKAFSKRELLDLLRMPANMGDEEVDGEPKPSGPKQKAKRLSEQ